MIGERSYLEVTILFSPVTTLLSVGNRRRLGMISNLSIPGTKVAEKTIL